MMKVINLLVLRKILWSGVILLLLIVLFANPQETHGQLSLPMEPLQLKINPQFPGPGQEVVATLSSNVTDLNRSRISWQLDGRAIENSKDSKKVIFRAGEIGEVVRLSVTVVTSDQQVMTEEALVRTATLDLLWEADSYTPPFYKGKGLPSVGSSITVTAIPDIRNSAGRKLSNDELVFTWKQSSRVVPDASGRGKNTATFPGPELYKNFDVILEVASLDQASGAVNGLSLRPNMPQVLLYEHHPTLGIRFEQALPDQTDLPGGEITVSAQPYFIGSEKADGSQLRYSWNLNGQSVANPSVNKSLIVLRADGEGGSAQVGVTIEHVSKIFQRAQRMFGINFAGEASF